MGLDINTKKGQESLLQERIMLDYVADKWAVDIIETNKAGSSVCDGFLSENGYLTGLFESKCRNLTYSELENFGSWLVTYDKIKECKELSKMLKVPFIGLLRLVPDNLVMYWKITDKNGDYLFNFNVDYTETQKTINGGIIKRVNAFLPIEKGNFLQ